MDYSGITKPDESMLTYSEYLKVDGILALQNLHSDPKEHDEMLFIIIHQVYELWFKQVLHEVSACVDFLEKDELMRVMAGFKRISAIQKVMIQQLDVLETMTPDDFARFRDKLNPASGFQSYQFRLFEFGMGLKDERFLAFYDNAPEHRKKLVKGLESPTLYDAFLNFLNRSRGLNVPRAVLERDVKKTYQSHDGVTDIYETVYRNPYKYSDIYLALEAMMDLDQNLSIWRYRHMSMVERIIGRHGGTGGSEGAKYLGQTLAKKAFPEIWSVRDRLGKSYS